MRLLILMAVTSILTGCMAAVPPVPYQEGRTKKQANNDWLDCTVSATQKVPVNTGIYTTPRYTTPLNCNTSFGNTTCTGGQTYGGNVASYDANARLREQVTIQCLQNKGYQIVNYEPCSRDVQKKHEQKLALEGTPNPNAKLISPFGNSCAYLHNQTTVLVDLAKF